MFYSNSLLSDPHFLVSNLVITHKLLLESKGSKGYRRLVGILFSMVVCSIVANFGSFQMRGPNNFDTNNSLSQTTSLKKLGPDFGPFQ